jgi:hypothetical protein
MIRDLRIKLIRLLIGDDLAVVANVDLATPNGLKLYAGQEVLFHNVGEFTPSPPSNRRMVYNEDTGEYEIVSD